MASEPRSISDLPDEIVLKILSHFGPEDLCLIIAKVCERWNVLAKDKILWKALSYSCDANSDISHISKVLRAAPALYSLTVRCRSDEDILKFLFHKHVDLRKLILKYCSLGEDSTGVLTNIVALYPNLEVLSLEGCVPLTSSSYLLIRRLKKLSELDLSNCEELSAKAVRLIANSCQHLKKLILDDVERVLFDDDVIHVINRLGKQLTTLVLNRCNLTDVSFLYLKNCSRLQELRLSFCFRMTDRGLLEGIGSLHELTSLRLYAGGDLTAPALSTFLHRPSMTSIVMLDLTFCRHLDDEGLKGIAKRCKYLKELAVCKCIVTDVGISMVVSHCNQLRVLNLLGLINITGKGFLALVPSHLPHLRELCLQDCRNVCHKSVEDLMAAVPELIVTK